MKLDKYTIKSQEVLQKAADVAQAYNNQAIEPGHLVKAILTTDENVVSFLFNKLNINKNHFESKLEEIITGYPKVSGQQPYLSNDTNQILIKAESSLKEFGDEFIAVEHFILGLLEVKSPIGSLMKDLGFEKKSLVSAINELRRGTKVTDQNAESKYRSLERYSIFTFILLYTLLL